MKKTAIKLATTTIVLLFSYGIGYAQVNSNGTVNPSISTENPFLDASTNFDSSVDPSSSGKGLVFPRTDLTSFTFKTESLDGLNFPTAFDGMIVYNIATGTTASGQGIVATVTPGFYYFSNPTGATTIDQGEWKRIGSAIDPVNVFVNDAINTLTYVAKKSDGTTTRVAGTEFVIKDNGSVGIGTTTPNTNAALEINSTTKGFLPPRMTTMQINAISAPISGMIIYNTTLECLQTYKTNIWQCIGDNTNIQTSWVATGYTGLEITGAAATTHYNGWVAGTYTGSATTITHSSGESFSQNTLCSDKYISVSPCSSTELTSGIFDLDGNNYPVVTINGQCWMSKNMKQRPFYSRANTGTTWLNYDNADVGSWGFYNTSDTSGASGWGVTEPTSGEGLLYQWSAVTNMSIYERTKGICPTGFHVPSDCEFMYLEHGLGLKISDAIQSNTTTRGSSNNVQLKLLSTASGGGNNASGFNGLFSGFRTNSGTFISRNSLVEYLTSTTDSLNAIYNRQIKSTGVLRLQKDKFRASELRCLKN